VPTKVSDCQQQDRVSQSARSGWAWTKHQPHQTATQGKADQVASASPGISPRQVNHGDAMCAKTSGTVHIHTDSAAHNSLLMSFLSCISPLEQAWWFPKPRLWHALISWQSYSLFNRRLFPVLLTPNDTLIYKHRLSLIAPWQNERQTPPSPSKDCQLINRQVSLRIYSPALSCQSLYSVAQAHSTYLYISIPAFLLIPL